MNYLYTKDGLDYYDLYGFKYVLPESRSEQVPKNSILAFTKNSQSSIINIGKEE